MDVFHLNILNVLSFAFQPIYQVPFVSYILGEKNSAYWLVYKSIVFAMLDFFLQFSNDIAANSRWPSCILQPQSVVVNTF